MAAELAWILLGLGVLLIGGIWWWGSRKSAQAPGNPHLRELTPSLDVQRPDVPVDEYDREWGVPPFEPLSVRSAEHDGVPAAEGPMLVDAVPAPVLAAAPTSAAPTSAAPPSAAPTSAAPPSAAPASAANAAEKQKIVTLRVCASGDEQWPGEMLLAALEAHGLAYGRYQVFHREHTDGRSLFCAASLIEPGTFDRARMSTEQFRGVTLFAVLPGPLEPLLTIDELLSAARGLSQDLAGIVQDAKGVPLSPQRTAALRDDVARFQATLPRA